MKQKEIDLTRRERQLRSQAEGRAELGDVDSLKDEQSWKEKEWEEKNKNLRLREEKIIKPKTIRRDKPHSETSKETSEKNSLGIQRPS